MTEDHQTPVLLVGAGGTLGRQIAVELAAQGYPLALTHSPKRLLTAYRREFADLLPEPHNWYEMDVTDESRVQATVKSVLSDVGAVPHLIYAAGTVHDAPLTNLSAQAWSSVLATNVTGAFHCIQALAEPLMVAGAGRIVLLGSVSADKGVPGQLAYAASKGALVSMCRVVAAELGRYGVTCNVVAPGAVESPMVLEMPPRRIEAWIKATPLRRLAQPSDVAHAVAFLLGPGGRHISGQVLHVDGGLTAA